MANTPHRATCGTCGGSGVTYHETSKTIRRWVKNRDMPGGGAWEVFEESIVEEKTCRTCGGRGTR